MKTPPVVVARLALNIAVFALFLGALAAFFVKSVPGRLAVDRAVVVAVAGGVWAGVFVTLAELRAYPIASRARRLALAATLGAATYAGLLVAVGAFSVVPVTPSMLAVGAGFGALVHALRAATRGGRRDDDEEEDRDDEDGDDGDAAVDENGARGDA